MTCRLGIDVGSSAIKAVLLGPKDELQRQVPDWRRHPLSLSEGPPLCIALSPEWPLADGAGERIASLRQQIELEDGAVMLTGGQGHSLGAQLGLPFVSDVRALALGIGKLYPEVTTVFEMGGAKSRLLRLEVDHTTQETLLQDYRSNGDCAAGCGSFLDQQAHRLKVEVDAIADLADSATQTVRIAGRCSVFARSDMIHAQQLGASPGDVIKGLCAAVARSSKGGVLNNGDFSSGLLFVGGVARNRAVVTALTETLGLTGDKIQVPPAPAHYAAIGAALSLDDSPSSAVATHSPFSDAAKRLWSPLDLDAVQHLPATTLWGEPAPRLYLGLDSGSVSTNLVALDDEGRLRHEFYLRTSGRPVETAREALRQLETELPVGTEIVGLGTTGSGRELLGELLGADAIHDEITAHHVGANHVAQQTLAQSVDTIFEIGGQDAKYIRLNDGVVVDFAMNEACSAGTGSFVEEQAERLGMKVESEFAPQALSARHPVRLGERCTVFMEQDVDAQLQAGTERDDLAAGVAYAVVQNYLNRVVRGRSIGETIFFQGGTAYNHAVAAAFSKLLGKTIIVPPHVGVMGAYGAALLARRKLAGGSSSSRFCGFAPEERGAWRSFTCNDCSNACDIQELNIDGRLSYWGDRCSEKFRRPSRSDQAPLIPDLFTLRRELIDEIQVVEQTTRGGMRIGLPQAMQVLGRLPFWRRYLQGLGHEVVLSPPTRRHLAEVGVESAVADPCFPVQVAHGHALSLLRSDVDFLLLPAAINSETNRRDDPSHVCPWGQTLPFVVGASPEVAAAAKRLLQPVVHFREGMKRVESDLWGVCSRLASSRRHHRRAVAEAMLEQQRFDAAFTGAGRQALETVNSQGAAAVVLLGRPYNLYDAGVNLNLPATLRERYGLNVLPHEVLPLDGESIDEINANMFWHSGRRIIQAACYAQRHPHLHLIYISHFGCGPDSYIKHFARRAAERPFLVLQLDGHNSDAGVMTRIEAYLTSKGVLR